MFKINPRKVFISYHKFYFVIDCIGCTLLRYVFFSFLLVLEVYMSEFQYRQYGLDNRLEIQLWILCNLRHVYVFMERCDWNNMPLYAQPVYTIALKKGISLRKSYKDDKYL